MIYLVAGTRPNFMKIAPIHRALALRNRHLRLMHTGQHFDAQMSDVFFDDLGIPSPDIRLSAGGGTHAEQTAAILIGVEKDLIATRPAVVVVVGDVTSTIAAALAAAKLGIPVVHVEAGLRSRDWTMPEEINRVLTDQLSDLLLLPSRDAEASLLSEGIPKERIVFVGNVMIDSLRFAAGKSDVLARLAIKKGSYALVTMHRPANVDSRPAMAKVIACMRAIATHVPVLFPVHPRTLQRIGEFGLDSELRAIPDLRLLEPAGYNDFSSLMANAKLVATDSGGIQEETTALGIPCLTLREGTERPITVTEGTNTVCGLDAELIEREVIAIAQGRGKRGRVPEGWDGNAAERVADAIDRLIGGNPPPKTSGARA